MSKSEIKTVSRVKTKKKVWYTILAPTIFGKKEIGESYLGSVGEAVGRPLKFNLKDLTGNMKDQNAYVSFKIIQSQGNQLETTHTGYELTSASVKRMVKKNCNRLDDYFLLTTKDQRRVVVKTLMMTIKKVSRSTRTQLRNVLKELLAEEFLNNNFDSVFGNVIANKTQYQARKQLAKTYPLRDMAIRKLFLVSTENAATKPAAQPAVQQDVETAAAKTPLPAI